ncbi:MAG: hypothetical protein EOO65_00945 [Methanosarcinales archaeon]|nr:MAG: hypothetical protein EOO65_00945 [Methanosarcinales archaeon]
MGYLQSRWVTANAEGTPTHIGGLSAATAAICSSDKHAGGAHESLTLGTSVRIKRQVQGTGPTTNPKRININGSDAASVSLVPSCGGAASSPDALSPPTMIFLKVDSGAYYAAPLTWGEVKDLRALALLRVLRVRDSDLSGLNARSSTVTIVPSITAGGRVPTAPDEKDAVLVDGLATLGKLAGARTTGDLLFIHVRTSPSPATHRISTGQYHARVLTASH